VFIMAIAREIVVSHRGRIDGLSEAGVGTTATVELPLLA
jgi:signal transduction histidine kinase